MTNIPIRDFFQDLPGPRCPQYVQGGFSSWPCTVIEGYNHDGPCSAPESPVSGVRRQQWLNARNAEQTPAVTAVPSGPVSGVPSPPPVLTGAMLVDPVVRDENQFAALASGTIGDLPDWARQGMIAASAQTSLGLLWAMCQAEFKNGASEVIITKDFLDRLVTPSVRDFLSFFTFQK